MVSGQPLLKTSYCILQVSSRLHNKRGTDGLACAATLWGSNVDDGDTWKWRDGRWSVRQAAAAVRHVVAVITSAATVQRVIRYTTPALSHLRHQSVSRNAVWRPRRSSLHSRRFSDAHSLPSATGRLGSIVANDSLL